MSFETKRAKSKLSNRLTRVYALLFSAIFLLLSLIVFGLAFRFLVQHQYDHLLDSLQLIGNNLKEELEEEQPEDDDERNIIILIVGKPQPDSNLAIFLYNGGISSIAQCFPLPDRLIQRGKQTPNDLL
jgi:hypothetical protein